ncbi:MAG: hypothetical protein HY587_09125 [Candidatus Omnitrophica bacterium]|nr:hypothetical protein [Candidatus Omnitrophota bacterium]
MIVLIAVVSIGILRKVGGSPDAETPEGVSGMFFVIEQNLTPATAGGCWVAAELFGGWYEPKTVSARYYVNHMAPAWFRAAYLAHGRDFAKVLHQHPELKPLVRPLFEHFASEGERLIRSIENTANSLTA